MTPFVFLREQWIRLFDFYSGKCLAKVAGHSELATGVRFTPDGRRLITTGGDRGLERLLLEFLTPTTLRNSEKLFCSKATLFQRSTALLSDGRYSTKISLQKV